MKPCTLSICLLLATASAPSFAQPGGHGHPPGGQSQTRPESPYAGLDQRDIKALSEDEIAGLLAGQGLAMALPAELNDYPGPLHVLEHADALGLDEITRERLRASIASMRTEAIAAGGALIEAERSLDRLFRDRRATSTSVDAATRDAALARSKLRAIHLGYHLDIRSLLSLEQLLAYRLARGYAPK